MKKIFCFCFVVVLLVCAVSCETNTKNSTDVTIDDKDKSNQVDEMKDNTSQNKEIDYVFYVSGTFDDEIDTAFSEGNVFLPANHLENNDVIETKAEDSFSKDYSKAVKIDSDEFIFSFGSSYKTSLLDSKNSSLRSMGGIDYYYLTTEVGETLAEAGFINGIDQLAYYSVQYGSNGKSPTQEAAVSKAKKVIEEIYGEGVLADYVIDEDSEGDIGLDGRRYVLFKRQLYGYAVQSYFKISLDGNCEVLSLAASSHLYYEQCIENSGITEEMLKNAEAALRETIPDQYNVQDHTMEVFMDYTDGKFYLSIYGSAPIEGRDPDSELSQWDVRKFYVNIT